MSSSAESSSESSGETFSGSTPEQNQNRTPEPPRSAASSKKTGSKRSLTRWVISIIVLLVVVAVIAAAILFFNNRTEYSVQQAAVPQSSKPVLTKAQPPGQAPDMQAVIQAAKNRELGRLSAEITDLSSGEVLFRQDENRPMVPASSTKVFTASAALLSLDQKDRVPTSVVQGEPGELIIVGEGDVTLSQKPDGGFFTDAPAVSDLATQVKNALKRSNQNDETDRRVAQDLQGIRKITIDNSIREGATFHDTWDRDDIGGGNVASLDSVMLDAGRLDPAESYSPRSLAPAKDVGQALADELGISGRKVDINVAHRTDAPPHPTADQALGQVFSAPLSTRIRDMMLHSDNLLAEAVGREVAIKQGKPGTFQGATDAIIEVLDDGGVDTRGAVLKDASGMSEDNRLSAHNLDSALSNDSLHDLLQDLPVSRAEGTLASRYGRGSGAEDAAGWVRAKTGTLDGVNALAGTVTTKSGRPVSFAFLSNGTDITAGREGLDRLAAALYRT